MYDVVTGDGARVGDLVGDVDGRALGVRVGRADGARVGVADGLTVGLNVGSTATVGASVSCVGAADGVADGKADGAALGTVKSVDDQGVVVTSEYGDFTLPKANFGLRQGALAAQVRVADVAAQLGAS